jgi:hypothetical protein
MMRCAWSPDAIASTSGPSVVSRGLNRGPGTGARAPAVKPQSPARLFAHAYSNRSATRQDRSLSRRFRSGMGLNRDIRGPARVRGAGSGRCVM